MAYNESDLIGKHKSEIEELYGTPQWTITDGDIQYWLYREWKDIDLHLLLVRSIESISLTSHPCLRLTFDDSDLLQKVEVSHVKSEQQNNEGEQFLSVCHSTFWTAEELSSILKIQLTKSKGGDKDSAFRLANEFHYTAEIKKLANNGDRSAVFLLAEEFGELVPLSILAAKGDREAIAIKAYLEYHNDSFSGMNYEEILELAESGNIEAQYQLYHHPSTTNKLHWLCHAADLGNHEARYRLGELYWFSAKGRSKNTIQAYKWYKLSALSHWQRARDAVKYTKKEMSVDEVKQAEELFLDWVPGTCEGETTGLLN